MGLGWWVKGRISALSHRLGESREVVMELLDACLPNGHLWKLSEHSPYLCNPSSDSVRETPLECGPRPKLRHTWNVLGVRF
jgi:hypothetical protein